MGLIKREPIVKKGMIDVLDELGSTAKKTKKSVEKMEEALSKYEIRFDDDELDEWEEDLDPHCVKN